METSKSTPTVKGTIENLTDGQFKERIVKPDVYLLDVRQPEEYSQAHIAGADNLDVTAPGFIEKAEKTLPANKKIAVYCRSGKRSAMAAAQLSEAGYNVLNLEGGIEGWIAAGLPVEN